MTHFSQTHLSNEVLRSEIKNDPAREGEATAMALARLAEYDARKLYLPDGFPSMLAYCSGELWLSEDEAKKRIRVARAGHRCPGVFEALAEGRVNLSGLVCLAKHLTPESAEELLAAASRKTRPELERLIAERFPRSDVAPSVEAIPSAPLALATDEGAPGPLQGIVNPGLAGAHVAPGCAHDRGRVLPLSPEAYAVQFTRNREADERFRYAQDLLGHAVRSGDIAEVYDRAMKELIKKLERVRFGACAKPRRGGRPSRNGSRHIPNHVKREVWKRDKGQCTYVSESGRRCDASRDLQFDHEKEFARGGEATVDNIRLRCPGHNQHTAEQTFGAGFVQRKRVEAAEARAAAKAAAKRKSAERAARAEASRLLPHQLEVLPYLRRLGCREDESKQAAALCRDMADATLEDRIKRALSWFGARIGRKVLPLAPAASNTALLASAPAQALP